MKFAAVKLFVLLFLCSNCGASFDVNDVKIQGDSSLMGMKIESSYFHDGAFLIETTGARYEYAKGQLKVYQGLDAHDRRLLSTITFDNDPNFVQAESNDDHILFWSENTNIGIYGDSTCIISPKVKQQLKCLGNFKPDYEGRHKGELLLIDEAGGIEVYPQRGNLLLFDAAYPEEYDAGYKIDKIELGKKNWLAEYTLSPKERVVVAAFPGRAFDWEKSFNSQIVFVRSGMGLGIGNPYGQMPPDDVLQKWSEHINILIMWYHGLYKNPDYRGPYIIANESEFRRLVKTSHKNGMKVTTYCSFSSHYGRSKDIELFFQEIKGVRDTYGTDGVYIDGLGYDQVVKLEMIRRLRQLFGKNGVIILHGTNRGSPVATMPNVDTYCDATINGENVAFKSFDEPYMKYQLKKYGISNTIALWAWGPHPDSINRHNIIDEMLKMNGRYHWWGGGYVPTDKPPPGGKYVWESDFDKPFLYYLERLENIKKNYNK